MNLRLIFATHLLLGLSIVVVKVDGLKCYVCGDDGELPCNDFYLKKDMYAKECVYPNNQGCEKKTEPAKGHKVIRKCSEKKFDDCEVANDVEYCYCLSDLCNSNISKVMGPTDDEDSIEGSGITTVSTETEKSVVTKEKSSGSKLDLYYSLVLILFVAMFYSK